MQEHKLELSKALAFIMGGKALFTIRNKETGGRFTYKVNIPKDQEPDNSSVFFVKLRTHGDGDGAYKYIGFINWYQDRWRFLYGHKSKLPNWEPGIKAFEFVFNNILSVGRTSNVLEVWHEGKCGRCGLTLTDPESIITGYGKICANKKSKLKIAA